MPEKKKGKKPPKKLPPPWIYAEPSEIESFNSWLYGGIDDLLDSLEYKQNDHFKQMCTYSKVVIAKCSQPMGDEKKRVAGMWPALKELRFTRVLIDSLRRIMKEKHEKERQDKELSEMYNTFYLQSLLTLVPPKEEEPKDDGTGKKKKAKKIPVKELIPALGKNTAIPFKTERPSKFPKLPVLYVTLGEIFESFATEVASFYEENKPEPPKEGEEDEDEEMPAAPVGPSFGEYLAPFFLKFAKKGQEQKYVKTKLTETASGLFNLGGKEGQEVRVTLFAILSGNKPLKIPKAKAPLTPEEQAEAEKNKTAEKAQAKDKKKKGGKKGKKAPVSVPEEDDSQMEFVDKMNIGFHRACTDFFHMQLLPLLAKEVGKTIHELLGLPAKNKKGGEDAVLYPLEKVNNVVDQIKKPWLTDHDKLLLMDEIYDKAEEMRVRGASDEAAAETADSSGGTSVGLDWLMLELMTAWIRFYHANEIYMHDEKAQARDKAMEMSKNMMQEMSQYTKSTRTKKREVVPPDFWREKMEKEKSHRLEQQRRARMDEVRSKRRAQQAEEERVQQNAQSGAAARKIAEDKKKEAETYMRQKEGSQRAARERWDRSQRLNCSGYSDMVVGYEEFKTMTAGGAPRARSRHSGNFNGSTNGHGDSASSMPESRRFERLTSTTATADTVETANSTWAEFLPPGMGLGGYSNQSQKAPRGQRYLEVDVSASSSSRMRSEEHKYQAFKAKSKDREKETGARQISMELPLTAVEMARTSSSIVEYVTQRRRVEQSRMDHTANWKRYVKQSKQQIRTDTRMQCAKELRQSQELGGTLPVPRSRPEQQLSTLHGGARGCYLTERAATKKAHEEVWPIDDRGM
jgi:hypothetical protein